MSIEQEIFQRRTLIPETLLPFGFVKNGRVWEYSEPFLNGDFRADVKITPDGQVLGSVFDVLDGEEYLPVHVDSYTGAFVGSVREAYTAVLQRIADACFEGEWFLYPQTNRIAKEIVRRFGEKPDFPFESAKGFGVFRCAKNRKWYGLVMDLKPEQVTGPGQDVKADAAAADEQAAPGKKRSRKARQEEPEAAAEDTKVEVINLKADPARIEELLAVPGIYPAYHMNKKNWLTVLLDGTVPDDTVLGLVETSRRFAEKGGKKERTGPVSWIVPANPRYYDVDAAFAAAEEILWKQGRGIRPGDTAYLYVAAPVSAVRYRCLVTETEIPYEYHGKDVSMTHVMKIRREAVFPPDRYPMKRLRELGMKTFQGVHPAPQAFLEAVQAE